MVLQGAAKANRRSLPAMNMHAPNTPTSLPTGRGARTSPRQAYTFDVLDAANGDSGAANATSDMEHSMDEFLDEDAFRVDAPDKVDALLQAPPPGEEAKAQATPSAQPSFAETDRDDEEDTPAPAQATRLPPGTTQTPSILPQKRPIDALQSAIHLNASSDALADSPLIRRPAGLSSARLRDATATADGRTNVATPSRPTAPAGGAIETPAAQVLENNFAAPEDDAPLAGDGPRTTERAAPQTPKQAKPRTTMDPPDHGDDEVTEVWPADEGHAAQRRRGQRSPTPPPTELLPGFDELSDSSDAALAEELERFTSNKDDEGAEGSSTHDEEYDSWDEEVDRDIVRAEVERRASVAAMPPPSTPPSAPRIAMDIPLSRDRLALETFPGEQHLLTRQTLSSPAPAPGLTLQRPTTPPSASRIAMDIPLSRSSEAFESWADKAPQASAAPPRSILKSPPERQGKSRAIPATDSRISTRRIPVEELGQRRRARFSLDGALRGSQVNDELAKSPRKRAAPRMADLQTQDEVPASEDSLPEDDLDAEPVVESPIRAIETPPSTRRRGRKTATPKSASPQKSFKVVATPRSSKLRALSQFLAKERAPSPRLPVVEDEPEDEAALEAPQLTPGAQLRRDLSDDVDLDDLVTPSKSARSSASKRAPAATTPPSTRSTRSGGSRTRSQRLRGDAVATPVFSLRPRSKPVEAEVPSSPPAPPLDLGLGNDDAMQEVEPDQYEDDDEPAAALDYDEPIDDSPSSPAEIAPVPMRRPATARRPSRSHTPSASRILEQLKTFGKTPEKLPRSRRTRHKPGQWWTTSAATEEEAGAPPTPAPSQQRKKPAVSVGNGRRAAAIPTKKRPRDESPLPENHRSPKRARSAQVPAAAAAVATARSTASEGVPARKRPSELVGPVSSFHKVRMTKNAVHTPTNRTPTVASARQGSSAGGGGRASGARNSYTPVSPASRRKANGTPTPTPTSATVTPAARKTGSASRAASATASTKHSASKAATKAKSAATPASTAKARAKVSATGRGARLSDVRSFDFEDDDFL